MNTNPDNYLVLKGVRKLVTSKKYIFILVQLPDCWEERERVASTEISELNNEK